MPQHRVFPMSIIENVTRPKVGKIGKHYLAVSVYGILGDSNSYIIKSKTGMEKNTL